MALLNFKLGNYTNLVDATKKAGTVYITKDEQAMYVDIDDNSRIRIGDIIQKNSVKEAKPPFNTDAFYYFVAEKALVRWTGEEWIQFATTDDIASVIGNYADEKSNAVDASIQARINYAIDIANQGGADLSDLTARVSANEVAIEQNATDIANRVTTTTFNEYKTSNAAAVAEAKQAGTDAATAAEKAQSTANQGVSDAVAALAEAQKKADINHASAATTYGVGNATLHGHVKLSDSISSTDGVNGGTAATPAAVKSAYDLANTAKTNADAAQKTADDNASAITGLDTRVKTAETDISGLDNRIGAIEESVGTGGSVTTDIATLKDNVSALQAKDTALEGSISQNKSAIDGLTSTVADNKSAAESAIKAVDDKLGEGYTSTATVKTDIDSVRTLANAAATKDELNTAKTELQGKIDKKADTTALTALSETVSTTYATKTELNTAKTELQDNLTAHINAANAMSYKKAVSDVAELPVSGNSIGDTYVASADFEINGTQVYVGDLLIANGEEVDNVITSELTWDVVRTGYNSTKDPKLTINDNSLELQNAAGGSLGNIKVVGAADSNITVSFDSSSNTLTVGMEWGTF